jgi:hypothetical protein
VGLLIVLVGGALVAWIKNPAPIRKLAKEAEEKLRDDLIPRVEKLETKVDTERDRHHAELAAMHADCDAEIRIMRHRVNNLTQCFDAFVMMARKIPEALDVVQSVVEMRERQIIAEAAEKSGIEAAKIDAATRRVASTTP